MSRGELQRSETWQLAFPPGDHHWSLGVRRSDLAEFFAPTPDREAVLAERRRWLAEDPLRYAQLRREGNAAFEETLSLLAPDVAADLPTAATYDRLLELGRRCEHDLVWLRPDAAGAWVVVGGVVCFPSQWALDEKLGLPMDSVHGPVPGLNAALSTRIDAFLNGLDTRVGRLRFNWSLAADAERNHHPHRRLPPPNAETSPTETFVRIEHQFLTQLPQSEAILFALRIEVVPLAEVRTHAEPAARLARLLETMSPEVAAYKNLAAARPQLVAYLLDA